MLRPYMDQPRPGRSGDETVAPIGILRLPSRPMCSLLTAGYFMSLWWLEDSLGWWVPFAALFIYAFFTTPRWDALGPGIGLPLALLLAYGLYFLQAREDMPLFAHFIVLALAAFPCVAPLGIRWPGRNPSNSIGRTGFILLAAPYFLLAGARAWPGLDHALSVMWSLIWSPIDRIPVVAPLVAVSIVFPFVKGRITDVGAKRWLHVGLLALFFAQFAALLIEALDPYAGALNTALAASLLLLCLWPSRNERLTQNEEIAPRREAEP